MRPRRCCPGCRWSGCYSPSQSSLLCRIVTWRGRRLESTIVSVDAKFSLSTLVVKSSGYDDGCVRFFRPKRVGCPHTGEGDWSSWLETLEGIVAREQQTRLFEVSTSH